jgi:hypothetical protein
MFWHFTKSVEGIRGHGYYRADLFRPNTIARFLAGLRRTAERLTDTPRKELKSLLAN